VSSDEFVESLLAAPVGVGLVAAIAGEHPAKFEAEMSFGELLLVAVDAGLVRVGPWMSESPASLADAYRHAGDRRPIAETIAKRFGSALHVPLDVTVQEWWHSGSPDVEWFTRPRFRRFDDVYGAGQFTFAGMWTVSSPPPEVHPYLIASWELEPDPVTRWHLPIEQDVRVWEIHRPADWVRLVTTFPAPGRVYDGWELPGPNQDRGQLAGLLAVDGQHAARLDVRQLVPDWAAVAAEFDGVHLSWAGFLTAEGFVSDLGGGDVTMLRYWFSERTLWLRDVFGEAVPLAAPHSGIPDVEVGIDVRADTARMEQDLTVLRLQRG
jgi:hypothetical protein